MNFDVTNAQTAMTIGDVTYDELYLNQLTHDNPQTVGMILDHQGRTDGWDNPENSDQPVRIEIQLRGIDSDMKSDLTAAFKSKTRVSLVSVDTLNGIPISGRQMLINRDPRSKTIATGVNEKFDVSLVLLCAPKNWNGDAM